MSPKRNGPACGRVVDPTMLSLGLFICKLTPSAVNTPTCASCFYLSYRLACHPEIGDCRRMVFHATPWKTLRTKFVRYVASQWQVVSRSRNRNREMANSSLSRSQARETGTSMTAMPAILGCTSAVPSIRRLDIATVVLRSTAWKITQTRGRGAR